jgi:hypothetical protein
MKQLYIISFKIIAAIVGYFLCFQFTFWCLNQKDYILPFAGVLVVIFSSMALGHLIFKQIQKYNNNKKQNKNESN